MKNIAYLGLGSNMGDRSAYLHQAVSLLNEQTAIKVEKVSSIYETDPVGYTDQDRFLNIAVKISTNLQPEELLQIMQSIEYELGRKREVRWGPRTIDLDILLYNHENIVTESLIIPHPRMYERAFVLAPLSEINRAIEEQISHIQLEEMKRLEGVTVWKQRNGEGAFVLFES
ncbi:2-amino-4-hydroxy-6-hydroxymethyldihydropteridine diphosphokinase [Ectobacillus panaciterrae]|uniref:2-amino-4-hydroxy-6- hydroxymethyldihydropteridine diphosphokinase n=1 Tax=Ectobacillus panaciterrae TaxID=363872 RepID=UPI00041B0CEF|nr:2-amino-4-hydroxy-6-hydroxymethyldihydropteridine diphosphokinase [Ectobacillus panaciterrae]